LCCKSILSISARNIDSRSGWNAQQRLNEAAGAAVEGQWQYSPPV
jgi:hypothetical protein